MLGGFLTPMLLSTGQDKPAALFGYIAILDAGLMLIALRRHWFFLVGFAALGTALLQLGWANRFFVSEKYFEGLKILTALAVLLGFNALYLAGAWLAKTNKLAEGEDTSRDESKRWFFGAVFGMVAVALGFALWFLDFPSLAQRPWLVFGFVFLLDLVVPALGLAEKMTSTTHAIFGLAIFGLLGFWTQQSLNPDLLNAALVFYLVFALLHSLMPQYIHGRRGHRAPAVIHFFPLLSLLLVLGQIFQLPQISLVIWPFILLLDLLAIGLAVLTGSLLSVLAVLVLTLGASGALILRIPVNLAGLSFSLLVLGGFALFFCGVGLWLARRFRAGLPKEGRQSGGDFAAPEEVAALLPSCSVVLPFLLLIMATLRLPLVDPSPVFGLALLLVILLLGVT